MDGIVILALSAVVAALAVVVFRAVVRTRREIRRFDMLHRIARASDRGGTLEETLNAICEIIVPEIADLCTIDLIKGERVERIAARLGPGGSREAVEQLARPGALRFRQGLRGRRRKSRRRASIERMDEQGP